MYTAIDKIKKITEALQQLGAAAHEVAPSFSELLTKLDEITRSYTSFNTFFRLVNRKGSYFPSLRKMPDNFDQFDIIVVGADREITMEQRYAELDLLALCYDMAQEARGDKRRAFRS